MSEPVLAPEEIEALMAEVGPAENAAALFAALPPLPQPEHVEPIRLGQPLDDGPDRYPMFGNLQERLVESFDEAWDALFKHDITVTLEGLEARAYRDIIADEGARVFMAFEEPEFGRMMMTLDVPMVVAFVDAMLGGDGEAIGEHAETLSAVERRLAERIAADLASMLAAVWKPVQRLDLRLWRLETDPQFLAVTGADDVCFSARFRLQTDDDTEHRFAIHYPRAFLDPMLDRLKTTVGEEEGEQDDEWRARLTGALAAAPAVLRCEIGRCRMEIGAFLALAPGDFLPLARRPDDPCTLRIGATPMFLARPGEQNGWLAAEITETIAPGGPS